MNQEITFICEECQVLNFLENPTIKKHNIYQCESCGTESYFTEGVEYIYLLDSQYSSLLKLGFTTREPINRLSEINIATGAIPWEVALTYQTLSGQKLEQELYNLFKDYRIEKKEQLEIEISKFVKYAYNEFELLPHFIREDLEGVQNVVSSKTENEQTYEPKEPTFKCPKCGAKNDTPYTHVRTYCKNCGRVIPRK